MLRSEIMRKTSIIGLHSDRDKILESLHIMGVAQPTELKIENLYRPQVDELVNISDNLLSVSRMVNILKLSINKLPFFQDVFGLETLKSLKVNRRNYKSVIKDSESFRSKNEKKLLELEEKYNSTEDLNQNYTELKEIITLYTGMGLPLSLLYHTDYTSIITGKILNSNIDKIEQELSEETLDHFEISTKKIDDKESIFIIVCLNMYINKVNFLIRKYNASTYTIPKLPHDKDLVKWINAEISDNNDNQKQVVKEINHKRNEIYDEALTIREELEIIKHRFETIHNFVGTDNYFVLQAWVMKKDIEETQHELEKITKGRIIIEAAEPENQDVVPVKLSNNKFLKPFEMLVELYSLPKYRDLDPTFIVGPLFVIFAAFMLTDAVYGSFLLMAGLFMYFKLSKYNSGLRDISIIISLMGGFTMIFGVLTGSYFGDLPKYFFPGLESSVLAFWKDPLTDPLYFLIVSLAVAVVYLNIGFILGCTEDYRRGDFKTMFKDRIVWFLLQLAIAGIYLNILPRASKYLLIGTVLAIVFSKGPLGLLDITGLMGDMISFSRLFALGLSTSGIALAVNLLANLVITIPVAGILLAVLIFIGGHMFGFVMNSIGGFVHSLRLQFVEFFGRFYEGGGDAFTPLKEERIYTEVEDGE